MMLNQRAVVTPLIVMTADSALRRSQLIEAVAVRIAESVITTQ